MRLLKGFSQGLGLIVTLASGVMISASLFANDASGASPSERLDTEPWDIKADGERVLVKAEGVFEIVLPDFTSNEVQLREIGVSGESTVIVEMGKGLFLRRVKESLGLKDLGKLRKIRENKNGSTYIDLNVQVNETIEELKKTEVVYKELVAGIDKVSFETVQVDASDDVRVQFYRDMFTMDLGDRNGQTFTSESAAQLCIELGVEDIAAVSQKAQEIVDYKRPDHSHKTSNSLPKILPTGWEPGPKW